MSARVFRTLCFFIISSLVACSSKQHAPVITGKPSTAYHHGVHRVQPGETLYAIAHRYGFDVQELATMNAIEAPYAIQVGQKLAFIPQKGRLHQANVVMGHTPMSQTITPKSEIQWQSPSRGVIVHPFSIESPTNNGIDIRGRWGQKVVAAADGQIVYAGDGLTSYGHLIIIRHDSVYLSAYAHNRRMLVNEGEWVQRGQKIAEMGKNEAGQVMLHFEIRTYGRPVDPQTLLG